VDRAVVARAAALEEAWAWGFDVDAWRAHLNILSWPEVRRAGPRPPAGAAAAAAPPRCAPACLMERRAWRHSNSLRPSASSCALHALEEDEQQAQRSDHLGDRGLSLAFKGLNLLPVGSALLPAGSALSPAEPAAGAAEPGAARASQVLREAAIALGLGPKRPRERRAPRPKQGTEGEDVVPGAGGGMQLRLPPRFGAGTLKAAAWHVRAPVYIVACERGPAGGVGRCASGAARGPGRSGSDPARRPSVPCGARALAAVHARSCLSNACMP